MSDCSFLEGIIRSYVIEMYCSFVCFCVSGSSSYCRVSGAPYARIEQKKRFFSETGKEKEGEIERSGCSGWMSYKYWVVAAAVRQNANIGHLCLIGWDFYTQRTLEMRKELLYLHVACNLQRARAKDHQSLLLFLLFMGFF